MDATGKEYWSTIQASVDQYYPIIRKWQQAKDFWSFSSIRMACHFSPGSFFLGLVAQAPGPSQEIFDKIDFWIQGSPHLHQVVSCCACMDDFNPDEGVFFFWEGGFQGGRFADLSLNVWHAVIKVVGNGVCCTGWRQHGWMAPAPGVKCSGKAQHFFCACECLEGLVEAQIASIMTQGGHILCPICKQEAGNNQEIHHLCVLGIPIIILYKASQLIN